MTAIVPASSDRPRQRAAQWTGLLRPALVLFASLSLLTGLAYPLVVTGIAQATWPDQAKGQIVMRDGQAVGSRLIGQPFSEARHFWSRPSATGYNGAASGGSNLGPSHPDLATAVEQRIAALRAADPDNPAAVPVDLVTTSASGLDPHISRAAADYQASRVARARGIPLEPVQRLIEAHTETPLLGFLGEARVNVLLLNLALD